MDELADKVARKVTLAFTHPIRQRLRQWTKFLSSTQLNQIPSPNTNRLLAQRLYDFLSLGGGGAPSHASRLADKFRGFGHS